MKKRIIYVLLTVMLLFVFMTVGTIADDAIQSGVWGELSWTLNETTGELVISGEGKMDSLVDTPVWLTYKNSIKSVVIKEGVTSIGNYAFNGCSNLSSVTIPDSVTSIGYLSFRFCNKLTEITIPESCTDVSKDAFSGCEYIATATIPGNAIPALSRRGLKNLTVTNGTSIPGSAFSDNSGLESIILPDTVTEIGYFAFYNCTSLKSIDIPEGVTKIGNQAFQGCRSLESIVIPDTVTSVGVSTFLGCKNLRTVVFPKNIRVIGRSMFDRCESLESFTFSQNVEVIESRAFNGCSSLTEVIIPDSVKEISDFAFGDCPGLKKLAIPDGIEAISGYSFDCTYNIETAVLPIGAISRITKNNLKTVVFTSGTSIPEKTFAGCTLLETVIFCGSEEEWKSLQSNKKWLDELKSVSFTYHSCQWEITDERHSGACSVCGSGITGEHIWDGGRITVEPSHLTEGSREYSCIVCQKGKTEVVDKTPAHAYGDVTEYDRSQHKSICACGDVVYADHIYGEWKVVTPSSEDSEGERQRICVCGSTVSEQIPKLTHEYVDTVVAPTCAEQGYTMHTCKNCGDSYKDSYVETTEHAYDDDQDKTCNECNALRDDISADISQSTDVSNATDDVQGGCRASSSYGFVVMIIIVTAAAFCSGYDTMKIPFISRRYL